MVDAVLEKLSENSCFRREGADARMICGADGLDVV
jgi:hypothetical protein